MRYFGLVIKGLARNKMRTLLTTFAIAIALFLFSMLQSMLTSMDRSVEVVGESRLITRNSISLIFPLPISYFDRIKSIPGVTGVSWGNWFGGTYGDRPQDFFAKFAVDPETYLDAYPEAIIPPDQKKAFLEERTACLVGEKLAEKFHWKVGNNVAITGTIYPGEWTYTIRGIYTTTKQGFDVSTMFFHWKYLDEGVPERRRGNVGFYVITLANPADAARVVTAIDALFENSSAQTRTETEKAFQMGFITMMGNIKGLVYLIGIAVVFAMVLVAANTMIMAGRERTRELAVLKTLGFDDALCRRLMMSESMIVAIGGGALGILMATLVGGTGFNMMGFSFVMAPSTIALALAIAIAIGIVSGFIPARRAHRLKIVDALRDVG